MTHTHTNNENGVFSRTIWPVWDENKAPHWVSLAAVCAGCSVEIFKLHPHHHQYCAASIWSTMPHEWLVKHLASINIWYLYNLRPGHISFKTNQFEARLGEIVRLYAHSYDLLKQGRTRTQRKKVRNSGFIKLTTHTLPWPRQKITIFKQQLDSLRKQVYWALRVIKAWDAETCPHLNPEP